MKEDVKEAAHELISKIFGREVARNDELISKVIIKVQRLVTEHELYCKQKYHADGSYQVLENGLESITLEQSDTILSEIMKMVEEKSLDHQDFKDIEILLKDKDIHLFWALDTHPRETLMKLFERYIFQREFVKLYIGRLFLSATYSDWYIEGELSEVEEEKRVSAPNIRYELYFVQRKDVNRVLELYNRLLKSDVDRKEMLEFRQLTE